MDTKSIISELTKVSQDFYNVIKAKKFKYKDEKEIGLSEIYDGFPSEFISYQDYLIEDIVRSPADECCYLLTLAQRSLNFILNYNLKSGKQKLRIYKIKELMGFALEGEKDKSYPSIQKELDERGNINLILGYGLLSLLAGNRLDIYLDEYPNAKKALFAYYLDELDKYSDSSQYAREAVQDLENFSRHTYKKEVRKALLKKGKYIKDKDIKDYQDDLTKELFSDVKSTFTGSISDDVIEATKGKKKENYAANRVAMKLIDRYKKDSKINIRHLLIVDKPLNENSKLTYKDIIEDSITFYDLIDMLEDETILAGLTDTNKNPFNLTAKQKYVMFNHLEKRKSFQEIADEMGIKKGSAYGHYEAALNKVIKNHIKNS
jgi:hypothetical protein